MAGCFKADHRDARKNNWGRIERWATSSGISPIDDDQLQ